MTFDKAASILGLKLNGLTEDAVKAAFASRIKEAHPDVAVKRRGDVGELKLARDTLLKICGPGMHYDQCRECKGSGTVRGTFASQVCPRCKGSGNDISGR